MVACSGNQSAAPVSRLVDPPDESPTPATPLLVMLSPFADQRWVETGSVTRGIEGGVRYEEDEDGVRVAESRFQSPIVRVSRVDDGWLFVGEYGVVARSDEFLGSLERVGELPVPLGSVTFDHAPGGMCIVDRLGGVHLIRAAGREPPIEPVPGEQAIGCVVMPGDEPLAERTLVWIDGGTVIRLSAPTAPIAPAPDSTAVGEVLAIDLVRERRRAHGLPDPYDGPEPLEDSAEPSLGGNPSAHRAIARALALSSFHGGGLTSHLAWVEGEVFDLHRGEWLRGGGEGEVSDPVAETTEADSVLRPAPEGASRVGTFDGRRGVAVGEGRLWWTADGGTMWTPVELPIDGGVAEQEPQCGVAGCVMGHFGLLWDAEPSAIPPLHRPANVLTREGPFAPLPSRPEPGRGLAAVRCEAPMPEEQPREASQCDQVSVDGTTVRYCVREGELDVRIGRGRRQSLSLSLQGGTTAGDVSVAFASEGWGLLVVGSYGVVVAPGGIAVHRRVLWSGVLAQLEGRGAQQELRVEVRGSLLRFDRGAARIGIVRKVFDAPWLEGLSPSGDLVVGASDGTLRVYDARTGEETHRLSFQRPVAPRPCPEGARTLRFRAHSYRGPELRFGEGEYTPWPYHHPVVRAALVDGALCLERLEAAGYAVSLRPDGGTMRDPAGGVHACVLHWSDEEEGR